MAEDVIEIGAALRFEQKSLDSLNGIFQKIEQMDKKLKIVVNTTKMFDDSMSKASQGVDAVNNKYGTLVKTVEKVAGRNRIIVDTYKDMSGVITEITNKINKENGELTRQIKVTQDIEKHEKEVTQALTKEYELRKKITNEANKSNNPAITPTKNIVKDIENAISKTLTWMGAMTMVYGTIRVLQSAFKTMVEVETEATNIFKVLPQGSAQKSLNQLMPAAITLAKQYGQDVTSVERSMAVWARQTKNVNDIITLTNASILAATATDISYEDSVKSLSAITAEWGMKASQTYHVVDTLNELSNNYRITATGLAEALAKTGSGARAAGIGFEELSGMITASIQSLGLEGGAAGTFITRILARMIGNKKAKEEIRKLGIDVMQPLSDVLGQLMIRWDSLSGVEKRNFAVTVAGTQYWSKFVGLMDNSDTILRATADAFLSAGSAQSEVNTMMATTEKQIAQLNATWQEFITRNMNVLTAVKAVVNVLESIVRGMNAAHGATLLVVGAFAALAAITGNWIAFAGILAAAAVTFGIMGQNAMNATQRLNELRVAQGQLTQQIEGSFSRAQGIEFLTKEYNGLREAIDKAKTSGQDYHGLQTKLSIVTDKLIQGIAGENTELANKLRKYTDLNDASKQALQDIVDEINADRKKNALMQAEILNTQAAKLTAHLTTLAMMDDEYRAWMHYESLKEKAKKNPVDAFKYGWEKAGGWYTPIPALFSGVFSSVSKGKGAFGNPVMDWLGYHPDWQNFENMPYMRELLTRREDLSRINMGIRNTYKPMSLDEVLGYGRTGESGGGGGTSDDNGTINQRASRFDREQAKWIMETALASDKSGKTPADNIKETVYQFTDVLGKITDSFQFKASSEAISQAEQMVNEWNSSIKEFVSATKSAYDSTNNLIEVFKKEKFDSLADWEIGFKKAFDGLVKPKNDIEQQIENMFTSIEGIYKDNTDKLQKSIEQRRSWITKADEQIAQNNSYLTMAEGVKSQFANKIPLGESLKGQLVEVLKGFDIDVTDITESTVTQLIALINAKNEELMRLKISQEYDIMGLSTSKFAKSLLNPDQQNALKSVFDNVSSMISPSFTNLLSAKNSMQFAQPKEGTLAEYQYKNMIYNAEIQYQQQMQDAISYLRQAAQKQPELAQGINALITWLDNIFQQSVKELKKPKDPFQVIEDKYKKVDDGLRSTMDRYGYKPEDFGVNTKIEVGDMQKKMLDLLGLLNEAQAKVDEYAQKLANGDYYGVGEAEERAKEYWDQQKNLAIASIETLKSEIERTKLKETFKSIVKGAKSFTDIFINFFKESNDKLLDQFLNNWSETFQTMNDNGNGSPINKFLNFFKSFKENWNAADNRTKGSVVALGFDLLGGATGASSKLRNNMTTGAQIGGQIGGPWGAAIGGIIGIFGTKNKAPSKSQIPEITKLTNAIKELRAGGQKYHASGWDEITGRSDRDIQATYNKIAQLTNSSIDNIADSLTNAFQADTYYDFLQSWGTSLEAMTRNALVKAFLATESFQGLYKNLQNTVVNAVVDGKLSADEITSIRLLGNQIGTQMKVLYQSLDLLDNMWGSNNTQNNSQQTYTAGTSTPIVYNNYITIQSQAFMGDEDDARTFAMYVRDYIVAEEARG